MVRLEGHAASIIRTVNNGSRYRKALYIPVMGPMPLSGLVGMGLAVEQLDLSLTANGKNQQGGSPTE